MNDKEFLQRLKKTFYKEAEVHLLSISEELLELEKVQHEDSASGVIEKLARYTHSLKGSARAVGEFEIEKICQSLESIFMHMKRNGGNLEADDFDLLHEAMEMVSGLIDGVPADQSKITKIAEDLNEVFEKIKNAFKNPQNHSALTESVEEETPLEIHEEDNDKTEIFPEKNEQIEIIKQDAKPEKAVFQETRIKERKTSKISEEGQSSDPDQVRVPLEQLKEMYRDVEELGAIKRMSNSRSKKLAGLLKEINDGKIKFEKNKSLTITDKLEAFRKLFDTFSRQLAELSFRDNQFNRNFHARHEILQDGMKELLMLPISQLFISFGPMIREISRSIGKKIDFSISGGQIHVDQRILQELKDPLVHLIRNACDHGIEKPEIRKVLGKPERGKVNVDIEILGSNRLLMKISDDGKGFDMETLRTASVKEKLIDQNQRNELDEEQLIENAFLSGLSTSPIISDLSGRGLGLSIVRDRLVDLGGKIQVKTVKDQGTVLNIQLPMTVTSFRGIITRNDSNYYVFPTRWVDRVEAFAVESCQHIENLPMILSEGRLLSLIQLSDLLGINEQQNKEAGSIVILHRDKQWLAVRVDEIVFENEVLDRSLGRQLKKVLNIVGSAQTDDGELILILNVAELFIAAGKVRQRIASRGEDENEKQIQRVLVVDDSLVSRTLIQNIIGSSGYIVDTAVDGINAFNLLKLNRYDIVVSDVEMPELDGFGLCKRIREDASLEKLPVILVTGLESLEDMNRGIEAGANAYIVKSGFQQDNLLSTIRRLI